MSSAHLFMEMEIKLKEWRVHPSDDDTFNASPPPSPFLCDEHFKQTRESLQLTNCGPLQPLQPRLSCVNDTAGYWLSMVVWRHKASKHHPDFFSRSQDQPSTISLPSYWEWGIAWYQNEDSIFVLNPSYITLTVTSTIGKIRNWWQLLITGTEARTFCLNTRMILEMLEL